LIPLAEWIRTCPYLGLFPVPYKKAPVVVEKPSSIKVNQTLRFHQPQVFRLAKSLPLPDLLLQRPHIALQTQNSQAAKMMAATIPA
jgi:hypothetical protein